MGTAYGNQVSFTTSAVLAVLPIVTTSAVTAIAVTEAETGGNVTSNGGASVTARGVAYGAAQNPTISGTTTSNGVGTGSFTSTLTGLTASTLYYVRAYATNSAGTAYGNQVSFTTLANQYFTVYFGVDMSQYVDPISPNGLRIGGYFSPLSASVNGTQLMNWNPADSNSRLTNMGNNIWRIGIQFPSAALGQYLTFKFVNGSNWGMQEGSATLATCGIDDGFGGYSRQYLISGTASTNYCWNLCTRCDGSNPVSVLPSIVTDQTTSITATGATSGGNVTADGGASVTARGVVYGTAQNPTTANSTTSNGTGTGSFTSTLTGLTASTLYYVRAYATNAAGTAYGNEVSFTTQTSNGFASCGSVPDIDGNTYQTVQIGTQCWTQSNLKVSKYRNGDNIPTGLDNSQWSSTSTGAYAIYNNDPVNDGLYGKLYNWYAVNDTRGICPTGWHVPSDAEWTTLTDFLGGTSAAGGKMKSTATQPTPGGWNSPNTGATNSSGFTGLPGGYRDSGGAFFDLGYVGVWWSSSDAGSSTAWYRNLYYFNASAFRFNFNHRDGYSVRCVRD
jgi:uncharacterized protein (TIGR02145 family)